MRKLFKQSKQASPATTPNTSTGTTTVGSTHTWSFLKALTTKIEPRKTSDYRIKWWLIQTLIEMKISSVYQASSVWLTKLLDSPSLKFFKKSLNVKKFLV